MERRFDSRQRHVGPNQADTWSHDRWSARPAGAYDRWGNAHGAYNGEKLYTMSVAFAVSIMSIALMCQY